MLALFICLCLLLLRVSRRLQGQLLCCPRCLRVSSAALAFVGLASLCSLARIVLLGLRPRPTNRYARPVAPLRTIGERGYRWICGSVRTEERASIPKLFLELQFGSKKSAPNAQQKLPQQLQHDVSTYTRLWALAAPRTTEGCRPTIPLRWTRSRVRPRRRPSGRS